MSFLSSASCSCLDQSSSRFRALFSLSRCAKLMCVALISNSDMLRQLGLCAGWVCALAEAMRWLELRAGWVCAPAGVARWLALCAGWVCALAGFVRWLNFARLLCVLCVCVLQQIGVPEIQSSRVRDW